MVRGRCGKRGRPAGRPYRFCVIIVIITALLASCVTHPTESADSAGTPEEAGGVVDGITDEFRQFLEIRRAQPQTSRGESEGSFGFALEEGVLRVYDIACKESILLWQSPGEWYVEDFRLGDVDGDDNTDLLFTLWKSYSFGPTHPDRMQNDDARVRCHLFLYTIRAGRMKQLWGSSSLPRPIYRFELTLDGEKSPVASGAVLRTMEGQYTEDFSCTDAMECVYAWRGWGFVEG